MPKRNVIILLIIGLPLSFFAGLKCQKTLTEFDSIGEPLLTTIKLTNDRLKDTIYLVSKRWGYTGDHQVFALTKTKPFDKRWQPNPSNDLIWKGENTIFYKQVNDTVQLLSLHLPEKTMEVETKQIVLVKQIDGKAYATLRKQVDKAIKFIE
jgi:hypothetical protein